MRSVRLQLTVDNLCSEDTLQILLNGESLEGERLERTHGMHHARMLGPPRTLLIWVSSQKSREHKDSQTQLPECKANEEGLGVQMPTTPPRARLPPAVPAWP